MVTIKDVARRAGVAVSTVSYVLSGNRPIGEATRIKVLDAVARLGYRPNRLAQGLVSKNSCSIGLLVPDLANPFFSSIAEAMEIAAHERGYSVILCNTNLDPVREADYLSILLSRQVDGLLYFPGTQVANRALQDVEEVGVPVIIMDERIDALYGVFVDNFDGGRQIGELLGGLGHRSILFIGGFEGLPTVTDRLNGLKAGLAASGVEIDALHVRFGEYRATCGYRTIHTCIQEGIFAPGAPGCPTAVVAGNDMIALGALRALREHGLCVPGDCSLVGFDGVELTTLITPSLTTVQQPSAKIAQSAIQLLLARIEEQDNPEKNVSNKEKSHIILPVTLVLRESVAVPPTAG